MLKTGLASERYLTRHLEPDLPAPPRGLPNWQNVLVIPACDEAPELLEKLGSELSGSRRTLIILVLNRPDSNTNPLCNQGLREAFDLRESHKASDSTIKALSENTELFLYDLEREKGPTPSAQGVGLARKVGCDIAFYWHQLGHIDSDWVYSSDADAALPADYFERTLELPANTAAAVFPFSHQCGEDPVAHRATSLYELRLHHYVLGLEYAGSPYAYHTLGSCLAIKQHCYAQVRGFPKRAGGEDFYFLNKAAKTGAIARLTGRCIGLESRVSERVPFGTGPAVARILEGDTLTEQPLFYHPQCFEALRACLNAIPELRNPSSRNIADIFADISLPTALASASSKALLEMGFDDAIDHCRRQGKSDEQFLSQFHQWFDGFRTLKFIHAVRDSHWPDQSLADLTTLTPSLWPTLAGDTLDIDSLRKVIYEFWHWTD